MAQTLFSLLLLRRLSLSSPTPTRLSRSFSAVKPLSTSSSPESNPPPSLSARMSFVFDQIDAMEKERSEKDETLHRIRAWRESRKPRPPEISSDLSKPAEAPGPSVDEKKPLEAETRSEVELVHPWPEWMELMERLVQQNYFDHRRKDEDKMIDDIGFYSATPRDSIAGDYSGVDFNNFKLVQTACINFGKDRFDILRPLSRQDIQTLVGFGCPSADKKVVFSSKLLRKRVHLDEGDVCSSCSLRNTCDRAYLLTMKEDEARFIDIMRVLFAYGFDPMNKEVLNPSPMKQKSVKTIVRKLLHQVVKLSSVPIDPNLPPPIIKKPPPKVKQPPPPPRKRIGRSDIEMKKGDWLCPKCDFMNFAKNNVCLQCDAKRPKRQLLPGEWECPQCNFLNYRRNTVCFHCDCKRPPDEFMENRMPESHSSVRARAENMPINRSEVSSAWNFDFDDDESDGADVAAFEYADSSATEKGPFDNQGQGQKGNFAGPEFEPSRDVRSGDGEYSDADSGRARSGFDDFDDEEDDVDSYEIDTGNRNSVKMVSPDQIPTFDEDDSGSEDISGFRQNLQTHHRTKTSSFNSQSKPVNRKSFLGSDNDDDLDLAKPYSRNGTKFKVSLKRRAFSGSDDDELDSDSDSEISAKPKWKSSHVADSRPRGRDRFSKGPSRGLSFGSDDDDEPDRNFGSRRGKANNDIRTRGSSRMKKNRFSGSESEDEGPRPHGNRSRGSFGPSRGVRDSKGYSKSNSSRDLKFGSRGVAKNGRRDSFDDDDDDDSEGFSGSSRGSRGGRGGFRKNNAGPRSYGGNGFSKSFKEPRSGGFGQKSNFGERQSGGFRKQQGERRSDRDSENRGSEDFKNSRRVIER